MLVMANNALVALKSLFCHPHISSCFVISTYEINYCMSTSACTNLHVLVLFIQ